MMPKFKVGNLIRATPDAFWEGLVIDDIKAMLIISHCASSSKHGLTFPAYYSVLIGETVEKRPAAYLEDVAETINETTI